MLIEVDYRVHGPLFRSWPTSNPLQEPENPSSSTAREDPGSAMLDASMGDMGIRQGGRMEYVPRSHRGDRSVDMCEISNTCPAFYQELLQLWGPRSNKKQGGDEYVRVWWMFVFVWSFTPNVDFTSSMGVWHFWNWINPHVLGNPGMPSRLDDTWTFSPRCFSPELGNSGLVHGLTGSYPGELYIV